MEFQSLRADRTPAAGKIQLQPLLVRHAALTTRLMNSRAGQLILDVGGGHLCCFAEQRDPALGTHIIGMDVLVEQMANNRQIDAGIVADACQSLPFAEASIDLLVTRSVMEQLRDNAVFLREVQRVLKPGGQLVCVFPCKFAPFAILNQLLPDRVAQRLLYYFFPQWREECGFKAYYNNCYYPRMVTLLETSGLQLEEIHFRYYQSIYFKFFVPLYLVSLLYDYSMWLLKIRPLACQILLVGRKTILVKGGQQP